MCERDVVRFTICHHRLIIWGPCKMYPVCNIKYCFGDTKAREKCPKCTKKAGLPEVDLNGCIAERYC